MTRPTPATVFLNLLGGGALVATGGLYLLLDKTAAISLYPLAVATFATLGLLALLPLLLGRRRALQIALPLALLCAMLAVRGIDWDSRKPFLRALNGVEPGMTIAQVDALMAGYLRTPAQPGGTDATVSYRHTNEGWGDSDIGVIRFSDGRVTSREFLPD